MTRQFRTLITISLVLAIFVITGGTASALMDTGGTGIYTGMVKTGSTFNNGTQGRISEIHGANTQASILQNGPAGPAGPTADENNSLPEPGLWAKALGNWGEQDPIDNVLGYEYSVVGFIVGVDGQIGDNLLLGINGGYLWTEVDSAISDDTDIDSLAGGVYLSYSPAKWFFDLGFNYLHGNIDNSRTVGTMVAKGDTDSNTYIVFANYGYDFINGSHVWTPILGAEWNHIIIDGFTETGVAGSNLQFEEIDTDLFYSTLGLKYAYLATPNTNLKLRALWTHEWTGHSQAIIKTRLAAAGPAAPYVQTNGVDVANDMFDIGVGLQYYFEDRMSIDLDYDLEMAKEFIGHKGLVKLKIYF